MSDTASTEDSLDGYDEILDILIEAIDSGKIEIGAKRADGKFNKSISNEVTLALLTNRNRYAATMAREARIEEIQLLIGAHNNDPSTDRYDVITVSRELLNKRMDALASPDEEMKGNTE